MLKIIRIKVKQLYQYYIKYTKKESQQDKKRHFIRITGTIHQEHIIIINIYVNDEFQSTESKN